MSITDFDKTLIPRAYRLHTQPSREALNVAPSPSPSLHRPIHRGSDDSPDDLVKGWTSLNGRRPTVSKKLDTKSLSDADPQLYEALKELYEFCMTEMHGPFNAPVLAKAAAALQRARGETE